VEGPFLNLAVLSSIADHPIGRTIMATLKSEARDRYPMFET
jgi:hypothetical protein